MEERPTPQAKPPEESNAPMELPTLEAPKDISPAKPNEAKPHRRSWLGLFRGK